MPDCKSDPVDGAISLPPGEIHILIDTIDAPIGFVV
jgi:hypothetical protein